jgi:hypothetical protein
MRQELRLLSISMAVTSAYEAAAYA